MNELVVESKSIVNSDDDIAAFGELLHEA